MKFLLLLPFLTVLAFAGQTPINSDSDAQVAVLGFKWFKTRLTVEESNSASLPPAPAMISANRNFERNRRANASHGERDPNKETLDGRSAALEKSMVEARARKPLSGFAFSAKIKNESPRTIDVLFWEYQFQDPGSDAVARRQFLCGVNIKPKKDKELRGITTSGPSEVVSVEALSKKTENVFKERVVINRVEYSDGTIWQRKGWNFGEVRLSYTRALATPWAPDMCKVL